MYSYYICIDCIDMNSFHWRQGTRRELSHSEPVVLAPGDRPIEGDPGAGRAGNINEIYINYIYIIVIYIYIYIHSY
jgi:hypothetical protein